MQLSSRFTSNEDAGEVKKLCFSMLAGLIETSLLHQSNVSSSSSCLVNRAGEAKKTVSVSQTVVRTCP